MKFLYILCTMLCLIGCKENSSNPASNNHTISSGIFPAAIAYSENWKWAAPYDMTEPAFGDYAIDAKTGFKIWRLGGSQHEMQTALNHPLSQNDISHLNAQHYYSRIDPTNSDETYALGSGGHKGGYAALWRLSDKKLVAWVPVGSDGLTNRPHAGVSLILWDKKFRNAYWYVDDNRLMRATVDLSNNFNVQTQTIRAFREYDYITLSGGEGDFSDDGSKLVIMGSDDDANASDYIIFYDVTRDVIHHIRERAKNNDTQLDWASVDPTGQWVVFDDSLRLGAVAATPTESWTWVVPWNNPTTEPRLLYPRSKHSDFVVDATGEAWIVYGNWLGLFATSLERSYMKRVWPDNTYSENPVLEQRDQAGNRHNNKYQDDEGYFHDHADDENPKSHTFDQSMNGHVSRVAAQPGTVLVSRESDKALYYINISEPGKTRYLGNTHNGNRPVQEGGIYQGEARGSAAKSGKYVFFVSDYQRGDQHYYLNMIELSH